MECGLWVKYIAALRWDYASNEHNDNVSLIALSAMLICSCYGNNTSNNIIRGFSGVL